MQLSVGNAVIVEHFAFSILVRIEPHATVVATLTSSEPLSFSILVRIEPHATLH